MSLSRTLIVIGAGGHGRVVEDIARRQQTRIEVLFVDDQPASVNRCDVVIAGDTASLENLLAVYESGGVSVVVAIGDNRLRKRVVQRIAPVLISRSVPFACILDPTAFVSTTATLGEGTVVMPQVAVNTGTRSGKHVILNTSCSVDHDCVLGDFVHVSPGAHLAGGVTLEDGVHVGTGASFIPGVRVGSGSVIGAGSVVVDDIPPGVVAFGIPARVQRAVED